VSFGLPTYGPGYGGYQQNPIGSNSFVNPYYTAQQGLGLGPVNVNPLFSFQTGTNDDGKLAFRPLVNLHVTPNGCNLLGCDKSIEEAASNFPNTMLKAIMDPFKLFGGGGGSGSGHGISADYTPPGPSYGPPDYNYALPPIEYGAPKPSYDAPPPPQYNDYGAVVTNAQRVPHLEYTAPKPSYNAPQTSYDSSVPQHQPQSSGGQTHFHHHYYHQQDLLHPEDQYGREDGPSLRRNFTESSGNNNYLVSVTNADSEVFKRHTVPDSAGFLPVNLPSGQSSSTGGSSGFKFPRARSLEAGDEKNSSASSAAEEVIEPRHSGGDRRRRRSPDGIGHHHAGAHHPHLQGAAPSLTTDTVRKFLTILTMKLFS
jgi:hypothetical protein